MPRGDERTLSLTARDIVESCRPSFRAICLYDRGCKSDVLPWKKSFCTSKTCFMMEVMISVRRATILSIHRAACTKRLSSGARLNLYLGSRESLRMICQLPSCSSMKMSGVCGCTVCCRKGAVGSRVRVERRCMADSNSDGEKGKVLRRCRKSS